MQKKFNGKGDTFQQIVLEQMHIQMQRESENLDIDLIPYTHTHTHTHKFWVGHKPKCKI